MQWTRHSRTLTTDAFRPVCGNTTIKLLNIVIVKPPIIPWSYPSLFTMTHELNSTSVVHYLPLSWLCDNMHAPYLRTTSQPGPGPGRERCCFEMREALSNVNCPCPRLRGFFITFPARPDRGPVPVATQPLPKVHSIDYCEAAILDLESVLG